MPATPTATRFNNLVKTQPSGTYPHATEKKEEKEERGEAGSRSQEDRRGGEEIKRTGEEERVGGEAGSGVQEERR